jgi:hypothetical protein
VSIPPTFVIFRFVAVTITLVLLLALGFGLRGHGPLHGLVSYGNSALDWLDASTGVQFR